MTELIKVQKTHIDGNEVNSVNARELHEYLESKQQFANWIQNRISKYDFVESQDYIVNKSINNAGQVISSDYIVSIDMAKELVNAILDAPENKYHTRLFEFEKNGHVGSNLKYAKTILPKIEKAVKKNLN